MPFTPLPAARVGLIALGFFAACSAPLPADRHALEGVVVATDTTQRTITVRHDAIPDVMPAMTMPFEVRGTFPTLHASDRIRATLVMTDTSSWLEGVSTVGRAVASTPQASSSTLVGTPVPDVRLVDHEGRPLAIQELVGTVVLVTFIYTRCPLPDYCPRLMRNIAEVRRALEGTPAVLSRVALLGVTLDPDHDTPAVLRAYGERFLGGPSPWAHVTLATGPIAETQALSGFFGIGYRTTGDTIDHSVGAAIIGAHGRVAAVLPGATWSAAEAVALIEREVASARKE